MGLIGARLAVWLSVVTSHRPFTLANRYARLTCFPALTSLSLSLQWHPVTRNMSHVEEVRIIWLLSHARHFALDVKVRSGQRVPSKWCYFGTKAFEI